MDTGVFDENRYFDVFVEYAKAVAEDILVRITVANRGPEAADIASAADGVVPQHVVMGTTATPRPGLRGMARPASIELERAAVRQALAAVRGHAGAAVHRERDATRGGSSATPTARRT